MEDLPRAEDKHSFAMPELAVVKHLDLDLSIDFDQKILAGTAFYQIEKDSIAHEIIFDTHHLSIDSVWNVEENRTIPARWQVGAEQPFLGSPLHIDLTPESVGVRIKYNTKVDAAALLWLDATQTHDKNHPFLFTQGQAILTRSWLPCQDSPGIRFTYRAAIQTTPDLMVVMSAKNPQHKDDTGRYILEMKQPIPAYLMAMAVGDLQFDTISARTGVYAEPGMLAASRFEMADMEQMVMAAERLFGPYLWERFDLLVLPPSFPFGGMENPRLTFATPTIIAGDRSLTSLVAHELAHSWSGNLVTNATWEDFWLNEGHTVYLERRIMEDLYGPEYALMLAELGYQDLMKTMESLGDDHPDTQLKLNLKDRNPDDGMTDIAYEKGYLLLRTLEEKVGREEFDAFLKHYFETFRFQTLSTEGWELYVQHHLIKPNDVEIDLAAWLYAPGLPEEHLRVRSAKLRRIDAKLKEFVRIGRLDRSDTRSWTAHEWLHFVRNLPTNLHISFYEKIDEVFDLSQSNNAEILAAWLEKSIYSGYFEQHNQEVLQQFLTEVGRRKFLVPLYQALKDTGHLPLARKIFDGSKSNYHSISAQTIALLLVEDKILG